ncbi:MAG: lysine--tRNA ligase [Fimbriimonadales bacterium]
MRIDEEAFALRLQKLRQLQEIGHDPYRFEEHPQSHLPDDIRANYAEIEGKTVSLAGRVTAHRAMGKAMFFDLTHAGQRMQVYAKKDDLGEALWAVADLVDIGDIVGTTGEVFTTRTGEISIHARDLKLLSKCLHTLPLGKEKDGEKWYGLTDIEERSRRRYLDLLANQHSRELFIKRSKTVSCIRRHLDEMGFLEVETPVLESEVGGAAARPFITFHNALEIELKLRISLELKLKRLIVGGLDKVYEIGRVFRNEGISTRHNPEFTLLELYWAYVKMEDIEALVEELCRKVAVSVFGSDKVEVEGCELDFGKPWARVDLLTAIHEHSGVSPESFQSLESAKKAMANAGLPSEDETDIGGIIEKLLERFVEPKLIQPTFVENYPIETSPLAKVHPTNPRLTRRFEGYVRGREVCNAFSELNDPVDQRERMELQAASRAAGNHEANPLDEDFLHAIECGLPPTGGLGIGIDRLVMLMAGVDSIRDVILFPTLRPESEQE